MNAGKLRTAIPLVLLGVSLVAYAAGISTGTFSQIGLGDISLICPLGALTAMIAARAVIPRAVVSIVLSLALFLVFGRLFCGWICPVPVVSKLRNLFRRSDAYVAAHGDVRSTVKPDGGEYADYAEEESSSGGHWLDSRHAILIGALVSTLVFGFPVFCLVCPIGLTFATVFLIFGLFAHADVTIGVVVAPVLLLVEVVFFKKWCHKICPLGALMSLAARIGPRTLRPVADKAKCIECGKGTCGRCHAVCDQQVNPRHPAKGANLSECTKCLKCVEACPVHAITLPVLPGKKAEEPEHLD